VNQLFFLTILSFVNFRFAFILLIFTFGDHITTGYSIIVAL